jgi:ribosomal protein L37E
VLAARRRSGSLIEMKKHNQRETLRCRVCGRRGLNRHNHGIERTGKLTA